MKVANWNDFREIFFPVEIIKVRGDSRANDKATEKRNADFFFFLITRDAKYRRNTVSSVDFDFR